MTRLRDELTLEPGHFPFASRLMQDDQRAAVGIKRTDHRLEGSRPRLLAIRVQFEDGATLAVRFTVHHHPRDRMDLLGRGLIGDHRGDRSGVNGVHHDLVQLETGKSQRCRIRFDDLTVTIEHQDRILERGEHPFESSRPLLGDTTCEHLFFIT